MTALLVKSLVELEGQQLPLSPCDCHYQYCSCTVAFSYRLCNFLIGSFDLTDVIKSYTHRTKCTHFIMYHILS